MADAHANITIIIWSIRARGRSSARSRRSSLAVGRISWMHHLYRRRAAGVRRRRDRRALHDGRLVARCDPGSQYEGFQPASCRSRTATG